MLKTLWFHKQNGRSENKSQQARKRLEILRYASVALLRVDARVFDACVSPCGYVFDNGLGVGLVRVVRAVGVWLVVTLAVATAVVFRLAVVVVVSVGDGVVFTRVVRGVRDRVVRGRVGDTALQVGLVVGRIGGSIAYGAQDTNVIRLNEWIVRASFRVGTVLRARVATALVAVAVRVGEARAERGRSLVVGAGLGVAPASVAAFILGHGRESGVLIGVVAILLDLFSALVLVILSLLALTPEEEGANDQQGDDDEGNDYGNGSLAAGAEALWAFFLSILELGRVGGGGTALCIGGARLGVWGGDGRGDDYDALSWPCGGWGDEDDGGEDLGGGWRGGRGDDLGGSWWRSRRRRGSFWCF